MIKKEFDFLKDWAKDLTAEQMRPLVVDLAGYSIESEMVILGDFAPYWAHTGEPLVDGQIAFRSEIAETTEFKPND